MFRRHGQWEGKEKNFSGNSYFNALAHKELAKEQNIIDYPPCSKYFYALTQLSEMLKSTTFTVTVKKSAQHNNTSQQRR